MQERKTKLARVLLILTLISNLNYMTNNYQKHIKLQLYLLIIFQWGWTVIYIISIIFSFWKLEIIKYLIIAMPLRIGMTLYDFDDNRINMSNPELIPLFIMVWSSALLCQITSNLVWAGNKKVIILSTLFNMTFIAIGCNILIDPTIIKVQIP